MSFLEIFQPGLRHLREERERQKIWVATPRKGAPPFEVDLDRGTILLRMPAENTPDEADPGSTDHAADRAGPE